MKSSTWSKSVTLAITSLYRAGAQTQLVYLAKGLRSRGWDVHVVYLIDSDSYAEELRSSGCEVVCLRMKQGVPDPRAVFRLSSELRRFQPLILHSHMIHANLLARAARLFSHVPVLITTSHNTVEGPRWQDILARMLFPLTDMHTCVSRAGAEYTVERGAAPKKRVFYVPNGIDVVRFAPDGEIRKRARAELGIQDSFVWLTIGRFDPQKAHHLLFEAFARLLDDHQDAELVMVGEGSLEPVYRSLIARQGISKKVRFLGLRKDIPEILNAADGFVMSSIEEGLPMVLLEAGARGLPIVTTDVGGNREAVLDGISGFVVPPNDVSALAQAMKRMVALTDDQRRAMGEKGSDHVRLQYSIDSVLDKWEEIYYRLLEEKSAVQNKGRRRARKNADVETRAHANAS